MTAYLVAVNENCNIYNENDIYSICKKIEHFYLIVIGYNR